MIKSNTYISRNSSLISRKIRNEFIIFDPVKGKLYQLNPTAEIIWKYLRKKRKFTEIVDKITKEFDSSKKDAKKDVQKFIKTYLKTLFYII